jgi:hypothetical protein
MPQSRAVLWLDHHNAQLLTLDDAQSSLRQIHAHSHYTRQHGSNVRTEHEFFSHVCDALPGVAKLLVTGAHQVQSDFRHYVDKHRPALAPRIVGWQTADHPSQGQLLAQARTFFVQYDLLAGGPATAR